MEIGASFSHKHLKWLGYDSLKALKDFKSLGLTWIRLGCYWSNIENTQGKFIFDELDQLLKYCEKEKLKIVLTVGMKAPRYPEYYLPEWLIQKVKLRKLSKVKTENKIILNTTLNYIEKCVKHFKNYSSIKVWQVENEPVDPSGPNLWQITPEFLEKEINLVRKLDPKRKILVNTWGNRLNDKKLDQITKLTDIVGFDIYLKHPMFLLFNFFDKYSGPNKSKEEFKKIADDIKSKGKDFWLVELQAEPWEPGKLMADNGNPPSFLPKDFKKNFEYGKSLNPSVILLWGFEWWYDRKMKGDEHYWNEGGKLITQRFNEK